MEYLKEFYLILDAEDFSDQDLDLDANAIYLQKIEELHEDDFEKSVLLNREREAIQFVKTTDEGLKPRMTGFGKTEAGEEVPIEWPDKRNFLQKDYDHIRWRFETTSNQYLKIEFGLFLFYSGYLRLNNEVLSLLELLKDFAKKYLEKSKSKEKSRYLLNYNQTIRQLLFIAHKRKKDSKIGSLLVEVCNEIHDEHLKWDLTFDGTMRFILDSTQHIKDYFFIFKSFDLLSILDKNWQAANNESKTYTWGAIYIADSSHELAKLLNDVRYRWQYFTAQQYEKLAEESSRNGTLAEVSFIEKALRIYQELKVVEDIERLSKNYQLRRDQLELSQVSTSMPEAETKQIYDNIQSLVAEYNEEQIVLNLCFTPMYNAVELVRQRSEESFKKDSFMSFVSVNVQDKFGNTIEKFSDEDERKEYAFLQAYGSSFQIGTQVLIQFIIEAIKAEKLSRKSVSSFLNNTWIGLGGTRVIHGNERRIDFLELLMPGINLLFDEIEKWIRDSSYTPNFICTTDSLTLKVEYLLREICLKIGLVTFKQRKDKPGVVMEKLLDDIIRDLKSYLDEDDYYFIKFLMTDKAGENLRNRIAHGLLDNIEYGLQYPFLILSVILKLSNYTFNRNDK